MRRINEVWAKRIPLKKDTAAGMPQRLSLRPILRAVEDSGNLNQVRLDPIDNNVGQGRECQFPPSSHSAAGSTEVGKIFQAGAFVVYRSGNAACCTGVVPFDPIADVLQILDCGYRLANMHQG
jgi:hypothetical protein